MSTRRFAEARMLFERIAPLPEGRRSAELDAACAGDRELRDEVESLLRADENSLGLDPLFGAGGPRLVDAAHAASLCGRSVGEFRLLRVLGAGGMGVVFAAEQRWPRRVVALKLLASGSNDSSARKRFDVEVETLGRLRHAGIAQVFAAGAHRFGGAESEDRPWIAMELVEGGQPLDAFVRERRLPLDEAVRLLRQVCAAVQYAHSRGVIHRDLKPGNVLVQPDGAPKVIDFGIARTLERGAGRDLTEEGALVGTLAYMAPEQLRGEDVDVRCDVYALGVMLYELVCGRPPHELAGRPVPAAYRLLAESSPAPPSTHRVDVPREIDWIAMRALERDREMRYASVSALDDDLARFLRHETVLAAPNRLAYRARKLVRRHRALFAAGGLLAASLLGTLIVYLVGLRSTGAQYGKVLRLSDARRANELRSRADDLWPADESLVPKLRAWLDDARALQERMADHRNVLAELAAAGARGDAGELRFEDVETEWWHAAQRDLVESLDPLYAPDGLVERVEARLRSAQTLADRTVHGALARARWDSARETVRDSSAYAGIELEPMLGLLPLGIDPDSGLLELLAIETGEEPARDRGGHLVPDERSGVVLVLAPPGSRVPLEMTYERTPFEGFDERAEPAVAMHAFLISKWELTQAQWARMTGERPSQFADPLRPVERVSWREAAVWLPRYRMTIPTGDEWTYAARAGRAGTWWFDREPSDWSALEVTLNAPSTAPVGSRPPNPFGLHDVYGNVCELCLGAEGPAFRGGYYGDIEAQLAVVTRGSYERLLEPDERIATRGIRPARELARRAQ